MKEIFSAFSTLQGSIRVYFICFFLILPFWFVDIVLFSKTFYNNHSFYLSLLVAFCISICWVGILILFLVNLSLTNNFYKTLETEVENFILYWVTILSIPLLGALTFIFFSFCREIPFKWFVLINFIIGCGSTPLAKVIIKSRKQKETQVTSDNDKLSDKLHIAEKKHMGIPIDNLLYSVLISLENKSHGSGFRLKYKDSNYLVTAKHVLFEEGKIRPQDIIVTCHGSLEKESKPLIMRIELTEQIVITNKVDDIAIIKLGTNKKLYSENIPLKEDTNIHKRPTQLELEEYVNIEQQPSSGILVSLDKEATRDLNDIQIGNDVYLMGYPTSLGMDKVEYFDITRPLLRKGVVAGINNNNNTFIIDCPAYYGNSGGPVVEHGEDNYYRIIGVVSHYIPFVTRWHNNRERITNIEVSNSGYSICTPLSTVFNLLDSLNPPSKSSKSL